MVRNIGCIGVDAVDFSGQPVKKAWACSEWMFGWPSTVSERAPAFACRVDRMDAVTSIPGGKLRSQR